MFAQFVNNIFCQTVCILLSWHRNLHNSDKNTRKKLIQQYYSQLVTATGAVLGQQSPSSEQRQLPIWPPLISS